VGKVEWSKAFCPICGCEYEYPENGYKPPTCPRFDCAHKYNHPEIYGAPPLFNGRQMAHWLQSNRQN
jgi:hypothetical protein